jgi:hypothetical protein
LFKNAINDCATHHKDVNDQPTNIFHELKILIIETVLFEFGLNVVSLTHPELTRAILFMANHDTTRNVPPKMTSPFASTSILFTAPVEFGFGLKLSSTQVELTLAIPFLTDAHTPVNVHQNKALPSVCILISLIVLFTFGLNVVTNCHVDVSFASLFTAAHDIVTKFHHKTIVPSG